MTSTLADSRQSLVVVQAGTAGPPLYCFHALGGSAAPYGALGHHTDPEHLLFGLQAIGLVDAESLDTTVLDMAHRYAMEISMDPPEGACVFLGYSLGGVLAVETARLLAHVLPEPALVVAIDSDPEYCSTGPDSAWSILVHQALDLELPVAGLATIPRDEALARVRAAATAQGKLPSRFSLDRLGRMFDVCGANEHAAATHRPASYPDTVVSIRSGDRRREQDSWTRHVRRVVVRRVPGDHHSIMGAGVAVLASQVRELLTARPDH